MPRIAMHSLLPTAAFLLSALAPVSAQNTTCYSGLYMVVARASTEAPGLGIIGAVCTMIQDMIPHSDSVAVVYPATLSNYMSSESQGTAAMTILIQQYVDACPGHKVALLGYSQGAQVVGDVLCGTSELNFKTTAPLAANYRAPIVAAIQMGDPTYVPGLSYDAGTSQVSGDFNRTDPAACDPSASILKSYCDTNDLYCAKGNSIAVHVGYVQEYGQAAAAFVKSQYDASPTSNSTSSSSSSPSSGTASSMASSATGGAGAGTTGAGSSSGAAATTAAQPASGTGGSTSGASAASAGSASSAASVASATAAAPNSGSRGFAPSAWSSFGALCLMIPMTAMIL